MFSKAFIMCNASFGINFPEATLDELLQEGERVGHRGHISIDLVTHLLRVCHNYNVDVLKQS